jgi:DNA-binding transcriptional MerR regulator
MEQRLNFPTKHVCRITGLTKRQVDYWDRTHFIKPSVSEAQGYGSTRLYSLRDVVQLAVAKKLKDKGISLRNMRKILSFLSKSLLLPSQPAEARRLRLVSDGESLFRLTENPTAVLDESEGLDLVFVVALGEIIGEVAQEIEQLSVDRVYTVQVGQRRHKVLLHREEGQYRAVSQSVKGLSASGETLEEALAAIREALVDWAKSAGPGQAKVRRRKGGEV